MANADSSSDDSTETGDSTVWGLRTRQQKLLGELLESTQHDAILTIVELPTDFRDHANADLIEQLEELVGHPDEDLKVPDGLQLSISGSAAIAHDMTRGEATSARATEQWTVILVVALLVMLYRAPLLAVIPMITVILSVSVSLSILALLAQAHLIRLFAGVEIYVTVLAYGAGVDY